jgi:hypothetical protein
MAKTEPKRAKSIENNEITEQGMLGVEVIESQQEVLE